MLYGVTFTGNTSGTGLSYLQSCRLKYLDNSEKEESDGNGVSTV
jgi:hypothetical protein